MNLEKRLRDLVLLFYGWLSAEQLAFGIYIPRFIITVNEDRYSILIDNWIGRCRESKGWVEHNITITNTSCFKC